MTQTAPTRRRAFDAIKQGVLSTPLRILVYGAEKVGKSTFAAGAPAPIFLGSDSGTERLDVDRVQPATWEEAIGFVNDIATEKHAYETIVVDPLGWFEPMVCTAVTGSPTGHIDKWEGGYGRGANACCMHWRELIAGLERCWRGKGMHVICVGHAAIKAFQNPEGAAYDRYELVLQKQAAGLFRQWVDVVGYANLETSVRKEPGDARARAVVTGYRALHLAPSAAYDAGSRLHLPAELPLGWDALWHAIKTESGSAAGLLATIAAQLVELDDPKIADIANVFTARHKRNPNKLAELSNRLTVKLEEKTHV